MTDLHTGRNATREERDRQLPGESRFSEQARHIAGRAASRGRSAALGVLAVALLGACSGGDPRAEPRETVTATVTTTVTAEPERMPSQKGTALGDARKAAEAAGYTASAHNANKGDAEPSGSWKVCFEDIGYGTVDYGAVAEGALCPKKDGGPLTWPQAPDVTGTVYAKAVTALTKAGLSEDDISVDSAYKDVTVASSDAESDPDGYKVCFQSLKAGSDVKPGTKAKLSLVEGGSCPSSKGAYKDRENDPDHTPPAPARDSGTGSSSGGGSGGGSGGSGTDAGQWNGQCELTSPAGNCYRAGQFCANQHVGRQTHDAGGRIIYCKERADGQRWNYS
ncbi:PASTA domain-containing protein [Streptomyces sp. F63]|uniref:Stk1 family PASTA domain-containing Ser/Thr kinase n=1 Tax=Streptomyces sp. F63 TaxID=2824887 RepID=UPI001B380ECE|nr:PASTA domain-containing protein [Streptomyces sp. F63]MBQ0984214.1 PASTA domain-containing protein [Streptomyces sp. F63]